MQLYRKISVMLSMGIMGIGLITFTIDKPAAAETGNASVEHQRLVSEGPLPSSAPDTVPLTPSPSPSPTPAPTPTPVPNNLQKELYPDIHELVENYLNAKLECSLDAFEDIVTDTSVLDLEDMQKRTEAIREYQNIVCYTKRGIDNIDYVVYYTYEMVIPTIDTPAASIDYFYVQYDDEGKPRVYLGEIPNETYDVLTQLNYDEDVQKLITDSEKKMEAAIKKDESLKAFWEKIQDIPQGDSEG